MAEKHLKKCSTSLAIREMQSKTTLRFNFTPVRMAEIKNTSNSSCRSKGNTAPLLVGMQTCTATTEITTAVSQKTGTQSTKMQLSTPGPRPGHCIHLRHTCSVMFPAGLHIAVRTWKPPRCSSMEELKKMWFLYTAEYCSDVKNSDIMKFAGKWVELEKKSF